MKLFIIIGIGIMIFAAAFIIGWKSNNEKELTEQEKTMRALRILIYIIIAIMLPTLIYKVLIWAAILKR